MNYHLTRASRNRKTGPIPVSTTSAESCPPSCPLSKGGCYAKGGPLSMHWAKVTAEKRGAALAHFLDQVRALPQGTLWRHNQAGDLPGFGDSINALDLVALTEANEGKRGFTYTHKPPTPANREAIAYANENGFTVNLSADNLAEADELAGLAIGPVVVVLPKDTKTTQRTPQGRTVAICPATQRDDVSCASCGLCARQNRNIVGFPAHGSSTKKASAIAEGVS